MMVMIYIYYDEVYVCLSVCMYVCHIFAYFANDGDDDDGGDDNNEGEISARQQISRKFQLSTNFGEVLTDGQTLYQLLTRPENITIRDDHGRRFQDHMT